MNYKGWRRRRPMKGPRRKPFILRFPGIITSGAQRADPEFWKERAEAEAAVAENESQTLKQLLTR